MSQPEREVWQSSDSNPRHLIPMVVVSGALATAPPTAPASGTTDDVCCLIDFPPANIGIGPCQTVGGTRRLINVWCLLSTEIYGPSLCKRNIIRLLSFSRARAHTHTNEVFKWLRPHGLHIYAMSTARPITWNLMTIVKYIRIQHKTAS